MNIYLTETNRTSELQSIVYMNSPIMSLHAS